MTTPITATRRGHYDSKGGGYEVGRYGEQHMEGYRAFRNDTLLHVLTHVAGNRPLRVLEVGCGTGLSLKFLAEASGHHSLFGLDASETMLRQAAMKSSTVEASPHLVLGDAGRLPYGSESFDVVFATRFMHQFPHEVKRHLSTEFARVVRGGGLIVLEFYARPYHWLRYHVGARKGRSREAYFDHYPSWSEIQDIFPGPVQVYPLRLAGSRLLSAALGERLVRRVTAWGGHVARRALLDEYFVVSRKP